MGARVDLGREAVLQAPVWALW
ncbi:MAG: hypothetical protein QOI43_26, partial [Gaiellales bacterium]|nr:hypothetical protein [Gaiellales bacterium]